MRVRLCHRALAAPSRSPRVVFIPCRRRTAAAGWPQFRGPNATGIAATAKAPPIEFGPGKNMLWKTAVPAGHSSPVFWGGRMFLTAFDGERKQLLVMALDRATGRELWRKDVPYEALGLRIR